jgi:hypothetical protein
MSFTIDITTEISPEQWQEFLDHSPNATPFHLQSWITVLSLTFGYKPLYLVAREADGTIVAGMPILERRFFYGILREYHSLYGGSYGSVILRKDCDEKISVEILTYFLQLLKSQNVSRAYVVDFNDTGSYLAKFTSNIQEVFTHILALDRPLEVICSNYHYSTRKNIKKAERNNIIVRDIEELDEVDVYYKITQAVAQKYKREAYSRELFFNIYKFMVPRGEAKFSLTYRDGQPLSGALHLLANGHIFNWLMPSYPDYLEYRPNEALVFSVIDWALKNGGKIYNFGGSPPDAAGLIRFKENWGTKKKLYRLYELDSATWLGKCIKYLRLVKRKVTP